MIKIIGLPKLNGLRISVTFVFKIKNLHLIQLMKSGLAASKTVTTFLVKRQIGMTVRNYVKTGDLVSLRLMTKRSRYVYSLIVNW